MGRSYQVSFADAWQAWEDLENATGTVVGVTLSRPRTLKGGRGYAARVALTATRREKGKLVERTAYCAIGGTGGAQTVPAAIVRAAAELATRLEEPTLVAEQLAAF